MQNQRQHPDMSPSRRIFPLTPEMVRRLIADQSFVAKEPENKGQEQAA